MCLDICYTKLWLTPTVVQQQPIFMKHKKGEHQAFSLFSKLNSEEFVIRAED